MLSILAFELHSSPAFVCVGLRASQAALAHCVFASILAEGSTVGLVLQSDSGHSVLLVIRALSDKTVLGTFAGECSHLILFGPRGHSQIIFRRTSLYFGGVLLKPQYAEIWVQRPIETRGCGSEYPL
jgi:predicted ABC-type transport system involved in lysophospholipase L1 biosynthesis ATPase subunit